MKTRKPNSMIQVLKEANSVYPDDCISDYFDMETGEEIEGATGDTLALFIGREITEVCDPAESLADNRLAAESALTTAAQELDAVIAKLRRGKP